MVKDLELVVDSRRDDMAFKDKSKLYLFDVDGTLTEPRKVQLCVHARLYAIQL